MPNHEKIENPGVSDKVVTNEEMLARKRAEQQKEKDVKTFEQIESLSGTEKEVADFYENSKRAVSSLYKKEVMIAMGQENWERLQKELYSKQMNDLSRIKTLIPDQRRVEIEKMVIERLKDEGNFSDIGNPSEVFGAKPPKEREDTAKKIEEIRASLNTDTATAKNKEEGENPVDPNIVDSSESTEESLPIQPHEITEEGNEGSVEIPEEQIVEISEVVLEEYAGKIKSFTSEMEKRISSGGFKAESVDVWVATKENYVNDTKNEIINQISRFKKLYKFDSLAGKLTENVNEDVFEGKYKTYKIPERVDNNPERFIASHLNGKTELLDSELDEIEDALSLAALNALYKYFQFQNSSQLANVIALQERVIKLNPNFDPARTGFFEMRELLQNSFACVEIDLKSKPNYQHAKPEYVARQGLTSGLLKSLSRVQACKFLLDSEMEPVK